MFSKIRNNKLLNTIYKNHFKISSVLVILFIISMFLFLYKNFYLLVDSDMSSELVLAKQLASERKIITSNWYYSTELRVLNTQLVFTPLFMIFDNWNIVRTLGTFILVIVLLLSFWYFSKGFNIKYRSYLSFLIVGSISLSYYSFVIMGAYYIPHIAISFFTLGLISRIMDNTSKKNIVRIIVLFVLSFLAGMGGLRQLLILYIPLCITSVIFLIYEQRKNLMIPKIEIKSKSFKLNIVSFSTILFATIGYMINSKILSKFIKFKDFEKIHFTKFSFGKFENLINGVISSFGYKSDDLVFSKSALSLNIMAIVLIMIVSFSLIYIIKNYRKIASKHFFITVFYIIAILTMSLIILFTDAWYYDRYLLPITIFFVPVIGVLLSNMHIKFYKISIIIFLVGYAFIGSWYYLIYTKNNNYKYKEFFDRRESTISTKSEDVINIKNVLLENEAFNGYSSYWTANILTELSDGKIDVWCFEGNSIINDIFEWLQLTSHRNEIPSGKVFVILNKDEAEKVKFREYDKLNILYKDKNRVVYLFNSQEELVSSLE